MGCATLTTDAASRRLIVTRAEPLPHADSPGERGNASNAPSSFSRIAGPRGRSGGAPPWCRRYGARNTRARGRIVASITLLFMSTWISMSASMPPHATTLCLLSSPTGSESVFSPIASRDVPDTAHSRNERCASTWLLARASRFASAAAACWSFSRRLCHFPPASIITSSGRTDAMRRIRSSNFAFVWDQNLRYSSRSSNSSPPSSSSSSPSMGFEASFSRSVVSSCSTTRADARGAWGSARRLSMYARQKENVVAETERVR
mmetsp:Transcript_43012/g.102332  ORF Transcript_43012/g.102332 Transcript_43012/m.102332 type:complete len:262 (-) Transcript_43012:144-929(-)